MCSLFLKCNHGIWYKYGVAWFLLYTVETMGRGAVGIFEGVYKSEPDTIYLLSFCFLCIEGVAKINKIKYRKSLV